MEQNNIEQNMELDSKDLVWAEDELVQKVVAKKGKDTAIIFQDKVKKTISLILNDIDFSNKDSVNGEIEKLSSEDIQKIINIYKNAILGISDAVKKQEVVNDKLIRGYIILRSNNITAFRLKMFFKTQIILESFKDFIYNPKGGFSINRTKESIINEIETDEENSSALYVLVKVREMIANFKNTIKTNSTSKSKELLVVMQELDFMLLKFINAKVLKIKHEFSNLEENFNLKMPKIFNKIDRSDEINKNPEIVMYGDSGIKVTIDFNDKNNVEYVGLSDDEGNKSYLVLLEDFNCTLDYQLDNYDFISSIHMEFLNTLSYLVKQNQELANAYIEKGDLLDAKKIKKYKAEESVVINNNKDLRNFLTNFLLSIERFVEFIENKLKTEKENQEKMKCILENIKGIEAKLRRFIDSKNNLIRASECILNGE